MDCKYRCANFLEALLVSKIIVVTDYQTIISELFEISPDLNQERDNRNIPFNILVINQQSVRYDFHVVAENGVDAYSQITNRLDYRTISSIVSDVL